MIVDISQELFFASFQRQILVWLQLFFIGFIGRNQKYVFGNYLISKNCHQAIGLIYVYSALPSATGPSARLPCNATDTLRQIAHEQAAILAQNLIMLLGIQIRVVTFIFKVGISQKGTTLRAPNISCGLQILYPIFHCGLYCRAQGGEYQKRFRQSVSAYVVA